MKRNCLPILLALCLLLSGCSGSAARKRYGEFSAALSAAEKLSFTAELRCEYEDRTVDFTLQYDNAENGCIITVIKPEGISGVKAHLLEDGSSLEYNSIMLDTGPLDRYGLSPLSALPSLAQALCCGEADTAWEENGQTVCRIILNDELTVTVWFDEAMTPASAQLESDGRVRVFCSILSWN